MQKLFCYLGDMVEDNHEYILLGVTWSKVPHKLDILCQPMDKSIKGLGSIKGAVVRHQWRHICLVYQQS